MERHKCYLLVDETYRDLHRGTSCPPLAATISSSAISVSSLSKAFGLPGSAWAGSFAAIPNLQELFLAAKEQIFICNSVVDEEIARRVLSEREKLAARNPPRVEENYRIVCRLDGKREASRMDCAARRRREPAADASGSRDQYREVLPAN